MYAIRATDGSTLWSTGDIGQMVMPSAQGDAVYVVDNNGNLAALRARDGALAVAHQPRRRRGPGPGRDGRRGVPGRERREPVRGEREHGAKAWKTAISGGAMAVPVAAGNAVYVAAAGNRLDAVHA